MQTRNLDVAVRELRSQQDQLLQIQEHDAERYACVPPASTLTAKSRTHRLLLAKL